MFEIWWNERLIDVVPALAGDVPRGLTVRSRAVGPVERIVSEPRDWRFTKVLSVALLMFLACVMVMTLTPVGEGGVDDGMFQRAMMTRLVVPVEPLKALPSVFTRQKLKQIFAAGASTTRRPTKVSVASLLGVFDDAIGKIGLGSSSTINDALNRLSGPGPVGGPIGLGGGSGPRGNGPGIGPGLGFVGAGGKRPGSGGADLKGKGHEGPDPGTVHIGDGLPRDLVAKVIRAHATEIKYCYERELQHTPGLSGKVAISFTIGGAGDVIEAAVSESSLGNSAVEQCMLDRVKRWRFPDPAGGGTVEVNHPWIFRGAGDNDP